MMKYFLLFILLQTAIFSQELDLKFPEPAESVPGETEEITPVEAEEVSVEEKKESVTETPSKTPEKKFQKINKKKKKSKSSAKDKSPADDVAYKMGKYNLKTGNLKAAAEEFSKGEASPASKIELMQIQLKQGKLEEAVKTIDSMEEPESQMKARLILANRLLAELHKPASYEIASNQYHRIIAEEGIYKPAALWGISQLFFKKHDYKASLDYLTKIILENPDSEYADDAYYLCGRIYETHELKNLENAKSFYKKFLKNMDKDSFKMSIYAAEVKKRLARLELK